MNRPEEPSERHVFRVSQNWGLGVPLKGILGLYRDYIGVISGLCRRYIGVIWGYIGILRV